MLPAKAAREPAPLTDGYCLKNNLRKFYASHAGLETIEKKFAEIAHWADEHGISHRQIFIGEFGVLRKEANKPGALCADRMRWLADIRKAADRQGFAWSYFSYDEPFALILSDNDRRLDQPVLASLGLKHTASKCEDQAGRAD